VSVIGKDVIAMGESFIRTEKWYSLEELMKEHFPTEDPKKILPMLQKLMASGNEKHAVRLWHVYDNYDPIRIMAEGVGNLFIKAAIALGVIGGIVFLGWLIFA